MDKINRLDNSYLSLPIIWQNVVCSLEGWRIKKRRFNKDFFKKYADVNERGKFSEEEVIEYRNERLHRFILHSYRTVPYYNKLFNNLKINPEDIKCLEDLKQLPLLTKDIVRENYKDFISKNANRLDWFYLATSGTTGSGLVVANTREASHESWATVFRYRSWHGLMPGRWSGHFGGRLVVPPTQKRPPFWRYNLPGKQVLFSAYHMSNENIKYYVDELRERKLIWLHGYPSMISLIANYINEYNIDLGYQVQWITTGSESLLANQRIAIKNAFGVKPIQHYGNTELCGNISECERGSLHVDEDFAAMEFIETNDGVAYKIIGTNFTNYVMPLIRYDTNDTISISAKKCLCGRFGRIVEDIDGRMEDYVILKNGARVGRLDHLFKGLMNIREAQIVQTKPGFVVFRIVRGKNFSKTDEIELKKRIKLRFQNYIDYDIDFCSEINKSKRGKFRFVISDVTEGKVIK